MRPLFQLNERLLCCAGLVRPGALLADVGTDHAYLPVWLAKQGKVSHALALDLREAPLARAEEHIDTYRVRGLVETRLSDGLSRVQPEEAEDIVIAGMGGELIARILSDALWVKNPEKRLILQPMTAAPDLRIFLAEEGFSIVKEQAVRSQGRIYTVLLAQYSGEKGEQSPLYPYLGGLEQNSDTLSREYAKREWKHLENQVRGLFFRGKPEEASKLGQKADALKSWIQEGES